VRQGRHIRWLIYAVKPASRQLSRLIPTNQPRRKEQAGAGARCIPSRPKAKGMSASLVARKPPAGPATATACPPRPLGAAAQSDPEDAFGQAAANVCGPHPRPKSGESVKVSQPAVATLLNTTL